MKDRIKKTLKNNQTQILYYTAGAVMGIAAYTYGCRRYGYQMVRPVKIEDGTTLVESLSGNIFKPYFPSEQ